MKKEAKEIGTFCPASQREWRQWLKKNHKKEQSVWLIYYKKSTGVPSLTYGGAVDEALCYGWIDSVRLSVDAQTFKQLFSKRKPKSVWSKVNKAKVAQLDEAGLITEAGYASIEIAKQNGSWNTLDKVEELEVPKDLASAFRKNAGSKAYFNSLSRSMRKAILQWLVMAKRPETRQKRIDEIAQLAARQKKPKQF